MIESTNNEVMELVPTVLVGSANPQARCARCVAGVLRLASCLALTTAMGLPLTGCGNDEVHTSPQPRRSTVTIAEALGASSRHQEKTVFASDGDPGAAAHLEAIVQSTAAGPASFAASEDRYQAMIEDDVSIRSFKDPVIINIRAGSVQQTVAATSAQRRAFVEQVAGDVLFAIDAYPHRLIGLRLKDLAISFDALSASDQSWVKEQVGQDAARTYESTVAALLVDVLNVVRAQRRGAAVSVIGLPVEPGRISFAAAQQTNQHYRDVIDELGRFISSRSFMRLGSSMTEEIWAATSMPEALRLGAGRSVVFRTNGMWRILVYGEERGDGDQFDDLDAWRLAGGDETTVDTDSDTSDEEPDERVALLTNDPFDEFGAEDNDTSTELANDEPVVSFYDGGRSRIHGFGGSGGGSGGSSGGGGSGSVAGGGSSGSGGGGGGGGGSGGGGGGETGQPDPPDSDGDGTPDDLDGCPNDPDKVSPGVCGCNQPDTDSDGDLVPDCIDLCPDDPNKIAPGQCGCGLPDTDSDGDGTADCLDDPDSPVTAVITLHTTTATKRVGCVVTALATASTLGTGTTSEHEVTWTITSFPAGFIFEVTDPRPGLQNGVPVNLRDGDSKGWSFGFQATHAGTYTIQVEVKDGVGNISIASDSIVVANESGYTPVYIDGNAAGGANNGTSPTNAYQTFADISAADKQGSDRKFLIAGGQTYLMTAHIGVTGSNQWWVWDGSGGSKPTIIGTLPPSAGGGVFTIGPSENITFEGLITDHQEQRSIFNNGSSLGTFLDYGFIDCEAVPVSASGNWAFCNFTISTLGGDVRAVFINIDLDKGSTMGAGITSFTQELHISHGTMYYAAGCTLPPSASERSWRTNVDALTCVACRFHQEPPSYTGPPDTFRKPSPRIENGAFSTFERCYMNGGMQYGLSSGTPSKSRVSRCFLSKRTDGMTLVMGYSGSDANPPAWGDDFMLVSCILEMPDLPILPFAPGLLLVVESTFTGVNLRHCTFINRDNEGAGHLDISGGCAYAANLFVSEGVDANSNSRFVFNRENSTFTSTDNRWPTDSRLPLTADKFYIYPQHATSAEWDADPNTSGDLHGDVALDAFFIPATFETVTVPNGVFADYYGNPLTPGSSAKAGAVQGPP